MYMYVVYTVWKYPNMLRKIVLDLPGLSRLKNGAGKQYRAVALQRIKKVERQFEIAARMLFCKCGF